MGTCTCAVRYVYVAETCVDELVERANYSGSLMLTKGCQLWLDTVLGNIICVPIACVHRHPQM